MFKRLSVFIALALIACSCATSRFADYPTVFAHRGCWLSEDSQTISRESFLVPENSLSGIRMAARFGYPSIECDVHWTSDSVLVCMHDGTINRTMRLADGQKPIEGKIKVSETDFRTLREKYRLQSSEEQYREPIPTLEEMLLECKACGIKPILHCDIYEGYVVAKRILGDEFYGFTSHYDVAQKLRKISDCLIFYSMDKPKGRDTIEPKEILDRLDGIGGYTGVSSMWYGMTTKNVCEVLKATGHENQSSIFPTPHEMDAVRNGATVLLSDFCWKPSKGMRPKVTETLRKNGSFMGPKLELGAMTVVVEGEGDCEVTIDGFRKYQISHKKAGKEMLSVRFCRRAPEVELKPAEGASYKCRIAVYEIK